MRVPLLVYHVINNFKLLELIFSTTNLFSKNENVNFLNFGDYEAFKHNCCFAHNHRVMLYLLSSANSYGSSHCLDQGHLMIILEMYSLMIVKLLNEGGSITRYTFLYLPKFIAFLTRCGRCTSSMHTKKLTAAQTSSPT